MGFGVVVYHALCVMLGIFYSIFGTFDLIADFGMLGGFGAKFLYEMDVIMGGLLGIPRFYSKIEGVLLLAASFGLFSVMFNEHDHELTFIGLVMVTGYAVTCSAYARIVQLPSEVFMYLGSYSSILLYFGYQDVPSGGPWLALIRQVSIGTALVSVISIMVMTMRATEREAVHKRYRDIVAYCDRHPDFLWVVGKDCPEGFSSKKTD
jgi:hypothetical protein